MGTVIPLNALVNAGFDKHKFAMALREIATRVECGELVYESGGFSVHVSPAGDRLMLVSDLVLK